MVLYPGYVSYSVEQLLALVIWRESRNQPHEAKFAVGASIRNSVQHPRWWGHVYREVILEKWQYTSMDPSDPNSAKFPGGTDASYQDSLSAAQEVLAGLPDNTGTSVSYFDHSMDGHPPNWASSPQFQKTVDLGAFHFFTLTEFGHANGPAPIVNEASS
jgi:hypothetical protein